MLLTIGVVFLFIAIIIAVLGHWVAPIALFAVGVILIYFAVQLRRDETRVAAAKATNPEIREREIVKVKCRYCGALNPDGARNCGSCGALL
jgi:ribosomal protein L40E